MKSLSECGRFCPCRSDFANVFSVSSIVFFPTFLAFELCFITVHQMKNTEKTEKSNDARFVFRKSRLTQFCVIAVPLLILTVSTHHVYLAKVKPASLLLPTSPIRQIIPELRLRKRGFRRLFLVNHPPTKTRYAFCSLAKNGCTIHMGLIHRLFGATEYQSTVIVHNSSRFREWTASAQPDYKIAEFFEQPNYRYAVIRNPMVRTISGYRNKVEKYYTEEQRKIGLYNLFKRWTEEQFPENATAEQVDNLNVHWMPQTSQCGFTNREILSLFTLIRFEEPERYASFVENILPSLVIRDGWGPDSLSFREYVTGPRDKHWHNVFSYYEDVEVFDRVARAMRRDIDLLGFGEEVSLMRTVVVLRAQNRSKTPPQ